MNFKKKLIQAKEKHWIKRIGILIPVFLKIIKENSSNHCFYIRSLHLYYS
jgi:hypothetical protein